MDLDSVRKVEASRTNRDRNRVTVDPTGAPTERKNVLSFFLMKRNNPEDRGS